MSDLGINKATQRAKHRHSVIGSLLTQFGKLEDTEVAGVYKTLGEMLGVSNGCIKRIQDANYEVSPAAQVSQQPGGPGD